MRAVFLSILLAATPLVAADVAHPVPVVSAVIYPNSAVATRMAALELPAGAHRLMVPGVSAQWVQSLTLEGARLQGEAMIANPLAAPDDFLLERQLDVRAARDQSRAARDAVADRLAGAQAEQRALEARLAYLQSISAPDADATPEALMAQADFVAASVGETERALVEVRAGLRQDLEALADANAALAAAEAVVKSWAADQRPEAVLALDLVADGGPVRLRLEQAMAGGWAPVYRLDVDTDASTLTITRQARLRLDDPTPWVDADVTLSTLAPSERAAPTALRENIARLLVPSPTDFGAAAEMDASVRPAMMAEPVVMEEAPRRVGFFARDRAEFVLPDALTLLPGGDIERTILTDVAEVEVALHAVPRNDDTAFHVVTFTNPGAPIFAGEATRYRDGLLVASGSAGALRNEIPSGAEAELGFGPHEGMRLSMVRLDELSGDRGIIQRQNTRTDTRELRVENISARPETVRLFYNLPVSVEDDLRIETQASPEPDAIGVDDKRGVAAWDLEVDPGETEVIRLSFDLRWPEDRLLRGGP